MAPPTRFIKMGELLEESAETADGNLILERLKLLAQKHLPEGWTEWRVAQLSKKQLLGNPVDPLVLNKIRFALPTLGVVRAFLPEADHLSEKTYRDIKVCMLESAFCRALIMSPPFVSNRIRGSATQTEIFNRAVRGMKPLLISRQEASDQLGETSEASSEEDMSEDSHGKRRRHSSKDQVMKRPRFDRVTLLENKLETMFVSICARLDDLARKRSRRAESSDEEEDELLYNSDQESSETWRAPDIDFTDNLDLDFLPDVKVDAPDVPEPNPIIKAQGIACQRFGSDSWDKIRYEDVQKRLQAVPVFGALKVNSQLGNLATRSFASDLLVKFDDTLSTIYHGLLNQRKILEEALNGLTAKHPDIVDDINTILNDTNSNFKNYSDDLLQFVCAQRAETLFLP